MFARIASGESSPTTIFRTIPLRSMKTWTGKPFTLYWFRNVPESTTTG